MADPTTKLVMTFAASNGSELSMSYAYIDPEVPSSAVKALVNGIIANGSIFSNVPLSAKTATIVTTHYTAIRLDN